MQLLPSPGIILGTFQKRNITSFCLWCGLWFLKDIWKRFTHKILNRLSDRILFRPRCQPRKDWKLCTPHTHTRGKATQRCCFTPRDINWTYSSAFEESCVGLWADKRRRFSLSGCNLSMMKPGNGARRLITRVHTHLWRRAPLSSRPILKAVFWEPSELWH